MSFRGLLFHGLGPGHWPRAPQAPVRARCSPGPRGPRAARAPGPWRPGLRRPGPGPGRAGARARPPGAPVRIAIQDAFIAWHVALNTNNTASSSAELFEHLWTNGVYNPTVDVNMGRCLRIPVDVVTTEVEVPAEVD